MINVNQITAQLAKMPDQALQQYASMHKNDPYTVSLALAESNRRKEMRTAAQGQQGGEQPKVVDQGIAEMMAPPPQPQQPQMPQAQAQPMPEDVGIGALPAPNMQGMAGGGIVAFAGEGPSLVQDMSPDAINERYRQAQMQKLKDFFGITGVSRGSQSGMTAEEKLAGAPAAAPKGPAVSATYPSETMRGAATTPPSVMAPPTPSPDAGGLRDLGGARPAPAAPRAPAAPEKGFADRFKEAMGETPDFEARRKANTAVEKAGEEEGLAKLKTSLAAESEGMFKGREERVGKREAALEKSKDTNTGMAFLEAGLAMMQSRGRGLAGIAEGASVGTKQYASGIKDIRAAQEKLDDARDRMEELRQNQSSMNNKEIRAAEKGIRDVVNRGNEKQLDGAEKMYGIKREDMKTALVSDIAVSEAAKGRATQMQIAGMPGDQQRMLTTLGGKGGLEAGLAKMQEIQADKTGAAYAKLFTETVAEANKAGVTPPTAAQFAASLRQLATAMNPTKVPPPVDATSASRS